MENKRNVKKRIKIVVALLLFISLLLIAGGLTSAGKINQPISLQQSCNNCTYCQTTVLYPNQTIFLQNVSMTKNGSIFNYTLDSSYILVNGQYCWWYDCGNIAQSQTGKICFDVTNTGTILDSSKAIIYIIIFVVSLLIFIGLLLLGIVLPVSNKKDEMTGYILAVNNLKYFKIICLCFAYLIALFIVYFSWAMSYSFLDLDFVTTMLRMIMTIQLVLILPLFLIFTYLMIANAVRDSKVADLLSRGLKVK